MSAKFAHSSPTIVLGLDEERVGDEAVAALASSTDFFVRRGQLVRVVDLSGSGAGVRVEGVPLPRLRERLSRCASWEEPADDKGPARSVRVPQWLVRAVAARGEWPGVQPLSAVVSAPVLRADGSVHARAGYDPATAVYLAPRGRLPRIEGVPDAEAASRAKRRLLDVGAGLGLVGDDALAAWIASMMTVLARFAFKGPSPLFVFDPWAMTEGLNLALATGSILHATAVESVEVGALARNATRSLQSLSGDAAIISIARFSSSNATTQMRVLDSLYTDPVAQGFTWIAVGERRALSPDVAARVVCVAPPDRSLAEEPSLDRARVYSLVLTLLRAHLGTQDRPVVERDGVFHGWRTLVEDALVAAGLPRVLASRMDPLAEVEHDPRAVIFDAIERAGQALSVGMLIEVIRSQGTDGRALRDAVEQLEPGLLGHRRAPQRLGHLLVRMSTTPLGARALVCLGTGMHGNRWTVRSGS